jgi:hypothetical protein
MVAAPRGTLGIVPVGSYASTYGIRLGTGFYAYRGGAAHTQWTRKAFIAGGNYWAFYDPSTSGWYFYNKKRDAFLPLSYLGIAEPASPEDTPDIDVPEVPSEEVPREIPPLVPK